MTAKFQVNADYFITEDARKYQIYIYIEGDINVYLYLRYESEATDPFQTAQEIIIYFK
jgi:hypothetical protein